MFKNKPGPYILLVSLLSIVFFIIGTRYGQKVERTNKEIDYLLTPSPTALPTQPLLQFTTYKNKGCGIQFLVPNLLTVEEETSVSSRLTGYDKTLININCAKNASIGSVLEDKKTASEEIKLENKTITAQVFDNLLAFEIKNSKNYKKILVIISKSLYPLFENSLQFLP